MKKLLLLSLVCGIAMYAYSQGQIIKVPITGITDHTEYIRKKLNENRAKNITLEFEKGVYHFYPERASGKYICISNNDNGYKRIAFDLSDMSHVFIKGNNTEFMFHGSIVPFYIQNSKNISISGINMDYDYSFIFEGEVIANNSIERSADIKISDKVKYNIKGTRFFFEGYDWEMPLGENIVFDKKTNAPYYYTNKYNHHNWKDELKARNLGNRVVRFSGFMDEVPPVGSIYTDKGPHGENRRYPGIIIHRSSGIRLENMNIYMSGAMALIGENSENISMNHFNVRLREGSGLFISASADATHFVNCKGTIYFDKCLFENMLDDATNVHGTYMKVKDVKRNCISVQFGHYQQEGFDFAKQGDTLRMVDRGNLLERCTFVVKDIEWVNKNYGIIHSSTELPAIDENTLLAVENISNMPSLVMRNCTVRNNRARSILISTSKPVLVENNYFDSMMAGILIAGDANKWFESGNVSEVIIRNNTFVNMGKGGNAPQSVLQISPEIPKDKRKGGFFHGKIVFENNTIQTFDNQVIYALSVKELIIRNNKFVQTKDYTPIYKGLSYIDIQNCKDVDIYGNTYEGEGIREVSATQCLHIKLKNQKGFREAVVEKPNTFFYQQ